MEYFDALVWLIVIVAIVAVGFFSALFMASRFAKEADQAWPDADAAEAETSSAAHH